MKKEQSPQSVWQPTENDITNYIQKHYGAKDIEVKKCDWEAPKKSSINSPFENILGVDVVLHWFSPPHAGDKSSILWNYLNEPKPEQVGRTPGEWLIDETISGDTALFAHRPDETDDICLATFTDKTKGADINLIAAAPDLLEAAKLFYELCNSANAPGNDDLDQLFAAINKATKQ